MRSYRLLTALAAWVLPLWLFMRQMRGKEDAKRVGERYGNASKPRPKGTLLWIHAASVGEAMSVLLLIDKIRAGFPHIKCLLTTGTVTSAKLMQRRLPKEAIHQYAPIDTPQAARRFIRHWKPQIALIVESELWPNLITAAEGYYAFLCLINGRMSERSFKGWQRFPSIIKPMIGAFDYVFAQSDADAERFRGLGAKEVLSLGNLKYDAAMLPCDEAQLMALSDTIGERPVWLAASTHPGEEQLIAQVHSALMGTYPNLLTIIVPRHPERGGDIATLLAPSGKIALRSRKEPVESTTQLYIADTLGELGLFYRLSDIVFIGGSLVTHGGQNPLEAARLACAIITGPHTQNFSAIYGEMEKQSICLRVANANALAIQVDRLLKNPEALYGLQSKAKSWVESKSGTADRLIEALAPALRVGAA